MVGAKVDQQQQLECWCWANMSARQYGRVALSINHYLTLAHATSPFYVGFSINAIERQIEEPSKKELKNYILPVPDIDLFHLGYLYDLVATRIGMGPHIVPCLTYIVTNLGRSL